MSTLGVKKRESNFELMRIVAMVMIVAHHLVVHGVQHCLDLELQYAAWHDGTFFNRIFSVLFGDSGGQIGVGLFFMVTGCFLCRKKSASVLKVSLQTIFYSFLCACLLLVLIVFQKFFALDDFFPGASLARKIAWELHLLFLPLSCGWWFVSAYILLVLTSPLINRLTAALNHKGLCFLLAVSWFFWYSCNLTFGGAYSSLGKAFFWYLLGTYYRISVTKNKHAFVHLLAGIFFCLAASMLSFVCLEYFYDDFSVRAMFAKTFLGALKNCIAVPLSAWFLFSFFARIHIPENRFINAVAQTTFGIYLIHDNNVFRLFIWDYIFRVSEVQFRSAYFPLLAAADVIAVFAVCSIIDFLRLRFIQPGYMTFSERLFEKCKADFTNTDGSS